MNKLEAETQSTSAVQGTAAVEIIDCGRVSERTRGFAFLVLFELGIPPQNTLLF